MNDSVQVPVGFSGWWCSRCEQACPTIPEDLDAAQARCPRCHKWTAVWVPGNAEHSTSNAQLPTERERRPSREMGRRLFDHIRHAMQDPTIEPDLRKLDEEEYKR